MTQGTRPVVGRLAPTPSGDLHLGNVCAFGMAWLSARAQGGRVLLRMEDVDRGRARPDVEDRQRRDLDWLGLTWDSEVPRQSERDYGEYLDRLSPDLYRCGCTRAQLAGSRGVYPGTCRGRGLSEGAIRYRVPPLELSFIDGHYGTQRVALGALGDPVLRRRDGLYSYMLAVVADDIRDGVTEVVRGADLLEATALQLHLWRVLDAPPPVWCHAPLIVASDGTKLSKSHGTQHVGALRDAGWSAEDVWRLVLPWLGLPAGASIDEALRLFNPRAALAGPIEVSTSLLTSGP